MNPVLEVKSLVKRYGEFTAVNGISFHINAGECFGLLGPNGAGKTTTVRILCCMAPPSGGTVCIDGMDIREKPREIKAVLGVCPQDINIDPDFSVRQNLIVYSRYFEIPRREAERRADELIEHFHLDDKSIANIEELSGGMKKRLIIARALINRPKVIILDEPTTGLDPQSRRLIWEKVQELKKQCATILLTTHYMEEAALLCDRLVIVDNGVIIEEGRPDELIKKHAGTKTLEDVFIKLTGKALRE